MLAALVGLLRCFRTRAVLEADRAAAPTLQVPKVLPGQRAPLGLGVEVQEDVRRVEGEEELPKAALARSLLAHGSCLHRLPVSDRHWDYSVAARQLIHCAQHR